MVSKLIQLVNKQLEIDFGLLNSETDVLVLQSFFKTKFSVHLVFLQIVFENIHQVGGFIKEFISLLSEEDRTSLTIKHNGQEQLFIDQAVYKKNQQFRVMM